MSRRHIPAWLFGILSAWLLAEIAMSWPRLPARLATHFGFSGEPNGWSTLGQFLVMTTALFAVFGTLLVVAGFIERMPDRFINLPNKAYWLAADRRVAALAMLRDWLRWFLVVTFAALVLLITAGLRANLSATPHLGIDPILGLAGFVLPQLIMVVYLYRRFRLPRE